MGAIAERTALESQQLKFEASGKVLVAFLEIRRHGQEERLGLQGCSPSLALRKRRAGPPACSGASFARAANREAPNQQVR